jgi:purine-binding chemotaxis protein CheW
MTMDTQVAAIAKPGKYLSFTLGGEVYGLEILKVQEINGIVDVTRVPRTPDYVRGVINLRGRVIPVIDLRAKFEMERVENTERTCIIVVQLDRGDGHATVGVVVDDVSEVMTITEEQISPPPEFGDGVDSEIIIGMGKLEDEVVILLDIQKVLAGDEKLVLPGMETDQ